MRTHYRIEKYFRRAKKDGKPYVSEEYRVVATTAFGHTSQDIIDEKGFFTYEDAYEYLEKRLLSDD